jgi:hypothetical protein
MNDETLLSIRIMEHATTPFTLSGMLVSSLYSQAFSMEEELTLLRSKQILLRECSRELLERLRGKWNATSTDDITLYLLSFIGALRDEWLKAMPANGFVTAATWPDIGPVEIEIRRAGAETANQALNDRNVGIVELESKKSGVE